MCFLPSHDMVLFIVFNINYVSKNVNSEVVSIFTPLDTSIACLRKNNMPYGTVSIISK